MESQKDRREIKDISAYVGDGVQKTNPFGGNVSAEQAYKRTERIAAAMYLVTNHVHEEEPVRIELRTLSTKLLQTAMRLRHGFRASGDDVASTMAASIREAISLTRILCVSGHLSKQNGDILTAALDDLGHFIAQAGESALADNIALTRSQLVPPLHDREPSDMPTQKSASVGSTRMPARALQVRARVSRSTSTSPAMKEKHRERRLLILDILKRSGSIGIKDISTQITDCGEKTIQRELLALVREGRVLKEGSKRWSQYKIIEVGA